jgi:excisionase family DNA binding protein
MTHVGLTTGEAASLLGVHPKTVQRWDREKKLAARRTPGGRRLYDKADVLSFLGQTSAVTPRRVVAYCRVSSQAQRPDLKNQRRVMEQFCLTKGLTDVEYVEEIGGGLNFKRPRFLELFQQIEDGQICELLVAHKDRLARFGFDFLQARCIANNCKLTVLNTEELSPEQEMTQDLLSIVHCFSSRLHGLRNYKKTLKTALAEKP